MVNEYGGSVIELPPGEQIFGDFEYLGKDSKFLDS